VKTAEDVLAVPGACLYYQVRGSGPLLLLLQGGGGDADASERMAGPLLGHFTVVTYDRRGLSRSRLEEGTDAPSSLETHSVTTCTACSWRSRPSGGFNADDHGYTKKSAGQYVRRPDNAARSGRSRGRKGGDGGGNRC